MVQWLRVLTALAKDLGVGASTHMEVTYDIVADLVALVASAGSQIWTVPINSYKHTHTHINQTNLENIDLGASKMVPDFYTKPADLS